MAALCCRKPRLWRPASATGLLLILRLIGIDLRFSAFTRTIVLYKVDNEASPPLLAFLSGADPVCVSGSEEIQSCPPGPVIIVPFQGESMLARAYLLGLCACFIVRAQDIPKIQAPIWAGTPTVFAFEAAENAHLAAAQGSLDKLLALKSHAQLKTR